MNARRACSSCGHEYGKHRSLVTAGADDEESSVRNVLLVIAFGVLYLWISTLSVVWFVDMMVQGG